MFFSELSKAVDNELLNKAKSMEKISDIDILNKPIAKGLENSGKYDLPECDTSELDPNSTYDIDGDICETDDNGNVYKKNGELQPDSTYIMNGVTYTTDSQGRITSWSGAPSYTPENNRDTSAQSDAGGDDRQEGDDGGHLVARVLGGSSDIGNIVPMRDTINRGDYKCSENEIASALKEGKQVIDSGKVTYDDTNRPQKIERTYTIDGEKTECDYDNVKGSQDLLENVEGCISDEDYESLQNEISDMKEDGCEVSVTSVTKKYDANGNLQTVRVGITNETTGEKTYKTYQISKEV